MKSEWSARPGSEVNPRTSLSESSITVLVKAGSRQETIDTSSAASFAAHGAVNGTAKYSKNKIDELIDSFGGKLFVNV